MQNEWILSLNNMYWFLLLVVYPSIVRNAYADITRAKLVAFYAISFIFIVTNLVILIPLKIKRQSIRLINVSKTEKLCLILLVIFSIISFLKNGHYYDSFIGFGDYAEGFLFLSTILAVFFLSHLIDINEKAFCIFANIGLMIVASIALFQFINIDLGKMYERTLGGYSHLTFISTMSNIDCAGFYFVIILPFAAFLLTQKRWNILGAVGVMMSTMCVIICNADSAIMGFTVEVILILLISLNDKRNGKISSYMLLLIGVSLLLVFVLKSILESTREIYDIQSIIASPIMAIFIIAFGILLLKIENNKTRQFIKVLLIVTIAIIALIPLAIIIFTNFNSPDLFRDKKALSLFKNILYFDNHWGSGRGYIWKCNLYLIKSGNFWDKLFGQGVCSFRNLYEQNELFFHETYGEMYVNSTLTDSHNMYLHFLLEYGLLPFISVFGFIVCRLKFMLLNDDYFYRLKGCALISAMIMAILLMSYNIHMAFVPALL